LLKIDLFKEKQCIVVANDATVKGWSLVFLITALKKNLEAQRNCHLENKLPIHLFGDVLV